MGWSIYKQSPADVVRADVSDVKSPATSSPKGGNQDSVGAALNNAPRSNAKRCPSNFAKLNHKYVNLNDWTK